MKLHFNDVSRDLPSYNFASHSRNFTNCTRNKTDDTFPLEISLKKNRCITINLSNYNWIGNSGNFYNINEYETQFIGIQCYFYGIDSFSRIYANCNRPPQKKKIYNAEAINRIAYSNLKGLNISPERRKKKR